MATSASLGYGGQLLPPLATYVAIWARGLMGCSALPPFTACSQRGACTGLAASTLARWGINLEAQQND